jgi:hypothetical protein
MGVLLPECFIYKAPVVSHNTPLFLNCTGNDQVSLSGKLFGSRQNNVRILFNNTEAKAYQSWNDSALVLTSPPNPEGLTNLTFSLNDTLFYDFRGFFYTTVSTFIELCNNIPDTLKQGQAYMLNCSDTIPEGNTLLIEPGAVIIVREDEKKSVSLTLNGNIIVTGSEKSPVRIMALPFGKSLWKGIILNHDATFINCFISNSNTGIRQTKGTSVIENCVFEENGTGLHFYGYNAQARSKIVNCTLTNNNLGLRAESRGNESYGLADIEITSSRISGNDGTGIELSGHGHTTSGLIPRSQASTVYLSLINSVISENKGFAVRLEAQGFSFSAIPTNGTRSGYARLKSYNNLIFNNQKGIFSNRINKNQYTNIYAMFYNTNFRNNNTVFELDANKAFFYNCSVWDNRNSADPAGLCDSLVFESCNLNDLNIVKTGKNNISGDPMYSSPDTGDFSLQPGSPCIDAGNNLYAGSETDFTGKARIKDGDDDTIPVIDIGAFEYISPTLVIMTAEDFTFTVFPNPARNMFYLRMKSAKAEKVTITLTDQLGRIMEIRDILLPAGGYTEEFPTSSFTSGIYLLKITSAKMFKTEKIIFQ